MKLYSVSVRLQNLSTNASDRDNCIIIVLIIHNTVETNP